MVPDETLIFDGDVSSLVNALHWARKRKTLAGCSHEVLGLKNKVAMAAQSPGRIALECGGCSEKLRVQRRMNWWRFQVQKESKNRSHANEQEANLGAVFVDADAVASLRSLTAQKKKDLE